MRHRSEIDSRARSWSAPERNKKVDRVIQRHTEDTQRVWPLTPTRLLTFPSDICASLRRQRTEVIDLLLNTDVY